MFVRPFRIEQFFTKYEFTAQYLLSSSDAESVSIRDLLALEPDAQEKLLNHWCGYTEASGAPWLRDVLASIYQMIQRDDVLVLSSAEEGIFVLYHALAGSDDHVIVESPCYESGLELARSTGAQVSQWQRRPEESWAHDVDALKKLFQPNTKILYINTPHNPTGLVMPKNIFESVINLAKERNVIVFCDEVYRELEHDPRTRLPAACDVYERAVSLGSVSKTYGLPGLRLGWLATRDADIIQRCLDFKYYTTICSSAPSEFLTALALKHRQVFVDRNLEIVRRNLDLLESFIRRRPHLFDWTKPNGGTIGFAKFKPLQDVQELCVDLVREQSVMLLPGDVYDYPDHIRFGFGRRSMPEALERLSSYLDTRF